MGIGDWGLGFGGLGVGVLGLGSGLFPPTPKPPNPNPQSPIPNPQYKYYYNLFIFYKKNYLKKLKIIVFSKDFLCLITIIFNYVLLSNENITLHFIYYELFLIFELMFNILS